MKNRKNLYFFIYPFNRLTDKERADGYEDQPVGEDNTKGEFVAKEGNEQFSKEDDLSRESAQPHDE